MVNRELSMVNQERSIANQERSIANQERSIANQLLLYFTRNISTAKIYHWLAPKIICNFNP